MRALQSGLVCSILIAMSSGCASRPRQPAHTPILPAALVGEFVDDYGIRYTISASEWFQQPSARYHIARADTAAGYLLARNDERNPGEAGLWTRIDWIYLTGMPPYEWAFCLSAYDSPTMAAAESVTVARRETPRTGCNGHPFSRMRRPAGP